MEVFVTSLSALGLKLERASVLILEYLKVEKGERLL